MTRSAGVACALIVIAAAAGFVWVSGQSMPATVASHFDAAGVADGFMARERYVRFMTLFVAGLPLSVMGVGLLTSASARRTGEPADGSPSAGSPVPWFVSGLAAFLAYVHWLVIGANGTRPPHLSGPAIYGGLFVFAAFVVVWTMTLRSRFRRSD